MSFTLQGEYCICVYCYFWLCANVKLSCGYEREFFLLRAFYLVVWPPLLAYRLWSGLLCLLLFFA